MQGTGQSGLWRKQEVVYKAPCLWVGRYFLSWLSRKTLGFVILALGWRVGLQLGDVADTFGQSLSEKHLSPDLQVFRVLYELEEYYCFLPRPQLLL